MKIEYTLAKKVREQAFVDRGERLEERQVVEVADSALSRSTRQKLVEIFGLGGHVLLRTTGICRPDFESEVVFTAEDPAPAAERLLGEYFSYLDTKAEGERRKQAEDLRDLAEVVAARDDMDDDAFCRSCGSKDVLYWLGNLPGDLEGYAEVKEASLRQKQRCEEIGRRRDQEALEKKAREEEAARAAREKARSEMLSWIEAHGSDHLRRASKGGYGCTRMYVRERAALEYPGFEVDFDDIAGWKERVGPSLEALEVAEKWDAKVVWLTSPAYATGDEDEDSWGAREAVVVEDFLGKYDLVLEMGS